MVAVLGRRGLGWVNLVLLFGGRDLAVTFSLRVRKECAQAAHGTFPGTTAVGPPRLPARPAAYQATREGLTFHLSKILESGSSCGVRLCLPVGCNNPPLSPFLTPLF